MPSGARPRKLVGCARSVEALQKFFGVARIARVTGLDRAGVEVACAVRPSGHVLQVATGKGDTWEEARATALSEAAELWAAERPHDLFHGSARELSAVWVSRDLVAPRLWSQDTRIAWCRGAELGNGAAALVAAQVVYCPPRGGPPLGPAVFRWTSNGMGAHPERAAAVRHAVLEALERDQLARALPRGWTPRIVAGRKLDSARLPLWQRLRDARLEAHVFDLSGRALPVAGAVLVDLEAGPLPVTAGYACGLTPEEAVRGALLEAAQSRLTDVHGAREDVVARSPPQGLIAACSRSRPTRKLSDMPRARRLPRVRAAVVDLLREPLHVVKVVAPDLRVSELL